MPQQIAVIGAGMSGVACASRLVQANAKVTLFDKGFNLGGRLATRIQDGFCFNHGAPGFAVESVTFKSFTDTLRLAGALDNVGPPDAPLVGLPHMNSLLKPLTSELDLYQSVEICEIKRESNSWQLQSSNNQEYGPFDSVAVCIPAPQARNLVMTTKPCWYRILDSVKYEPCLTAMIVLEGNKPDFRYASLENHPQVWRQIEQVENGKCAANLSCWVVHATPAWSSAYLECDYSQFANELAREFLLLNELSHENLLRLNGHRWRYARVNIPLGELSLFDNELQLGLAGDWCLGPNVENAFCSGIDIADKFLLNISKS